MRTLAMQCNMVENLAEVPEKAWIFGHPRARGAPDSSLFPLTGT